MAVFGNIRILDNLNLGYTTDINPFIGKIIFNAQATDLTSISTELSINNNAGSTKGFITIPSNSGLLIGNINILDTLNASLNSIKNESDNKTKIHTLLNNILFTTGEISIPQGINLNTIPIINIKKDVDNRLKTFFNTDIIQNIGSFFETNSTIIANQGLNAINGDIIINNGNLNVSDNAIITTDLSVGGICTFGIINTSDLLTVSSNGINITGNSIFNNNLIINETLNINLSGGFISDGISTFNNNTFFTSGYVSTTNNVPLIVDGLITANTGLTIPNGNLQILNGDVNIVGNLTVTGTTSTIDATNLNISDNIITINNNESGAGVSSNISGIEIDRGSLENFRIIFEEFEENLKFGPVSDVKVVALRDDDVNMTDGYIPIWNGLEKRFETIGGLNNSEVSQLSNINNTNISPTQWTYIGNMNQDISNSSNVIFNNVTVNGILTCSTGIPTLSNNIHNFDNTLINNNNAINSNINILFMQNLSNSLTMNFGTLNPPTSPGIVKHFIFLQKNASAGIYNNFIQIRINSTDFNPPYNPPTGTPPTFYTIEFQHTGQSANIVSAPDNKWYLLNASNCILTDNGIP